MRRVSPSKRVAIQSYRRLSCFRCYGVGNPSKPQLHDTVYKGQKFFFAHCCGKVLLKEDREKELLLLYDAGLGIGKRLELLLHAPNLGIVVHGACGDA